MARGFLSGVLWGGVVSLGVAGVASTLAPLAQSPDVADVMPGVSAPARSSDALSGDPGGTPDSDLVTPNAGAQTDAPDPDGLGALDGDTVTTAAQPQTGQADLLTAPATGPDAAGVSLEGDDPVLPNPQALAPMLPQDADALSISTEPAQPPQPAPAEETGAFDSAEAPQSPDVPDTTEAEDPATAEIAEAPAPSDTAPAAPAPSDPAPSTGPAPEAPQSPDATEPADPETETAAVAPELRPSIGTPAASLLNRDNGVSVNRPAGSDASAAAPAEPAQGRPLERYAQPFDLNTEKPLMSIILIDDGTSSLSGTAALDALGSFPYPLTFAVDSALPDAPARAALYRAQGFEVLAMIDLPQGAQPSDAETTFAVTLAQLPEVVGVLGAPSGRLQTSREVSDQVAAILAQSGHGWVTQPKGLDTAATLARRAGVPAATVFRDFDSSDQTAVVIRRFLDQAAFRAGQDDGVIMLGRLRPETISALLLWGLQDRAGQVALAPISAILRRAETE